jgi:hypothetical protein
MATQLKPLLKPFAGVVDDYTPADTYDEEEVDLEEV